MSTTLDDDDLARCIAFLDGTLPEDERERFLRRLAAEPGLAQELESVAAVDDALRARPRPQAVAGRRASRGPRAAWIVAAAAALVVALLALGPWNRSPVSTRVALVASDESPLDWLERHRGLETLRPPGLDALRAHGEPPNVGAREFVERALAAARGTTEATETAEIAAGYYRVEIAAAAPVSALVVALPAAGAPARVFPEEREALAATRAARCEAGRHVLPREPFALVDRSGEAGVEYDRGFLVPVGARSVRVLVATRAAELEEREIADLDAALARGEPEAAIESTLREHGFDVRVLVVREPR